MKSDFESFNEAIKYFPETGIFIWKISLGKRAVAGSKAGGICGGYWRIMYRGHNYQAHRIAWLLMTGNWPMEQIDHKNLDRADNRWCNLRLATHSQNMTNRKGRGKYPKGVHLHKGGKFVAQINNNGIKHYLGVFSTPAEANAAYAIAARKYFGEFARVS